MALDAAASRINGLRISAPPRPSHEHRSHYFLLARRAHSADADNA